LQAVCAAKLRIGNNQALRTSMDLNFSLLTSLDALSKT